MARKPPNAAAEKLSLYKPATPLGRDDLTQARLETSLINANNGDNPNSPSIHLSADVPKASNVPLKVHVVRHTPLEEKKRATRFSSDFMPFDISSSGASPPPLRLPSSSATSPPPPSSATSPPPPIPSGPLNLPETEKCGGENEEEEERGDKTTNEQTLHPPTTPLNASTQTSKTSFVSKKPTEYPSSNSSSQAQKKKPPKSKGRVIPSRYMSSTKSTSVSTHSSLHHTSATGSTASTSLTKTHTSKRLPPGSGQKPTTARKVSSRRAPSTQNVSGRVSSSLSASLLQHTFTPSAIVSSTPKVSSHQLESSASLQESLELSAITTISSRKPSAPATSTKHKSKAPSSSSSSVTMAPPIASSASGRRHGTMDRELDLLFCRLLQSAYLDVKSAKALRLQEDEAKSQMLTVWKEVETRRDECQALKEELETAKLNTLLSSVLDIQAKELAPVISALPRLKQQHSTLARSLDIVRSQIQFSGVLPLNEEQFESELSQSEGIISDLLRSVGDKLPTVVSFAESTAVAVDTLDREFQELEKCWRELSAAVKLQVKGTSLEFEASQRSRDKGAPPSLATPTPTPTLQSLSV